MKLLLSILVLTLPLLCSAQTVWRCGPEGRVYSDSPCAEGRRVDVAPIRPDSDLQSAQQRAQQDMQQAEQMRRERLAREAAVRGNGLVSIGPQTVAVKPPVLKSKPHRKRHPASPEAVGTWRSTAPVSRQKQG